MGIEGAVLGPAMEFVCGGWQRPCTFVGIVCGLRVRALCVSYLERYRGSVLGRRCGEGFSTERSDTAVEQSKLRRWASGCSTLRNHPCGEPRVQKVRRRALTCRLGARKSSIRAAGEEPRSKDLGILVSVMALAVTLIIITANNIFYIYDSLCASLYSSSLLSPFLRFYVYIIPHFMDVKTEAQRCEFFLLKVS